MVLFCSHGSDSARPSRLPFCQPACPFLASRDHFRPSKAPAPTGSVAVSSLSGRPAAAAGMILLRQVRLQYHPCPAGLPQPLGCCLGPEAWRSSLDDPSGAWCIKKVAGARGAAKKFGTHAKLHRESAGCETRTHDSFMRDDQFTAVLEALHMSVQLNF